MRRLVVCCDGTWNRMEQETGGVPTPTNVVRLYHALVEDDTQLRYYHPGVGTGRGPLDRLGGGGMGVGLARNIQSAYAWLGRNYRDGDAIHVFGFSRGAYTVRSLVGMIDNCGLAPLTTMAEADQWAEVHRLYFEVYRPANTALHFPRHKKAAHRPEHRGAEPPSPAYQRPPIAFLGVWDTVGALGIPDQFAIQDLFNDRARHEFHHTELSPLVVHARHALAVDEQRAPFTPTLWTDEEVAPRPDDDATPRVRQVWFPGVHCDVGGGYPNSGLSDGALLWMINEATACTALKFQSELVTQISPRPDDVLHNSMTSFYRKLLGPRPRPLPSLDPDRRSPDVHHSVYQRQLSPPITAAPYRPSATLDPGASAEVEVFAGVPWNNTGLYLTPGSYELSGAGEWIDGHMPAGPEGGGDGRLEVGDLVWRLGDVAGWVQEWLRRTGKDHHEQVLLAPRYPEYPWMALIGCVAARDFTDRGELSAPEPFLIGSLTTHAVAPSRPGYLYAFANDAWAFYDNNHGSLRLNVTRLT